MLEELDHAVGVGEIGREVENKFSFLLRRRSEILARREQGAWECGRAKTKTNIARNKFSSVIISSDVAFAIRLMNERLEHFERLEPI